MLKIIARTVFYQWFIICCLLVAFVVYNVHWTAHKIVLFKEFIDNAFFPVQWNNETEQIIKNIGAYRFWLELDYPEDFTILQDEVYANNEWYWAEYSYTNKLGETVVEEKTTRVRWKTWEYYYGIDIMKENNEIKVF